MIPTCPTALAHESYEKDPDTLDLPLLRDPMGVHRRHWTWSQVVTFVVMCAGAMTLVALERWVQ